MREKRRNPTVAFGGVELGRFGRFQSYRFGILNSTSYQEPRFPRLSFLQPIGLSLNRFAQRKTEQIIATGIANAGEDVERLRSRLWLSHGIITHTDLQSAGSNPRAIAEEVANQYDRNGIAQIRYGPNREVIPQELVSLGYYERADPRAIEQARFFAEKLKEIDPKGEGRVVHISSTPQGGGVAIMRHAEMRLAREMGLNMHWHVMEPDSAAFDVTKRKFHNVFQDVAPEGTDLTDDNKRIYQDWIAKNAEIFRPVFKSAKVLIIDDPQPSGLIPYALRENPDLVILYRSHIEIINSKTDTPGTIQNKVWEYLWNGDQTLGFDSSINGIQAAKAFVTHPIKSFIPTEVPRERVFGMAPTTDRFDGLNKPLSRREMKIYLGAIDRILTDPRYYDSGEIPQTAIDHSRPYVSQRARLDPSKGYPDLMISFKRTWEQIDLDIRNGARNLKRPQLVMIANTAADDPDAQIIYNQLKELRGTFGNQDLIDDIKIIRAPHNDLLLNAVTRGSRFVTQLSTREGFEFNVEEAIMKGKPVIGSNRGGIYLQIDNGAGFLVDPGSPTYHDDVSGHMYDLFTNKKLYRRMSRKARNSAHNDFKTERNMANWMWLSYNAVKETNDPNHPGEVTNGNFGSDEEGLIGYVPRIVDREYARYLNLQTTRRRSTRDLQLNSI